VRHVLVAGGRTLANEAAQVARENGLGTVVVDAYPIEDEVSDLASGYARRIRAGARHGAELIVRYGEPVVKMPPEHVPGRGGRALQLALAVAGEAHGVRGWTLLAAGSDGFDGSSDAAGAVVDGETWAAIQARRIKPEARLKAFDAHSALDAVGALVRTGATGNNLGDLQLLLLGGA